MTAEDERKKLNVARCVCVHARPCVRACVRKSEREREDEREEGGRDEGRGGELVSGGMSRPRLG